jgi:hypothetical protein
MGFFAGDFLRLSGKTMGFFLVDALFFPFGMVVLPVN